MSDKTQCEALTQADKQCSRMVDSTFCTQHKNFDPKTHRLQLCKAAYTAAKLGEAKTKTLEEVDVNWPLLSEEEQLSWIAKRQDYLDQKALVKAKKSAQKEPKTSKAQNRKCDGTTKKDKACGSWAMHGSTRCVTHQVPDVVTA